MSAEYTIRELRPEDAPSLLDTFNTVFAGGEDRTAASGSDGPPPSRRPRPRTLEEWRWAFERNPAGLRAFVALHGRPDGRQDGRQQVVAQYAGLPLTVRWNGRDRTFVSIVDSMVHPEHRAGLKRPGLFVNTARAFFDAYGGPDADLVHFGMPVEEAWRIGQRFLDYEICRNHGVLGRAPAAGPTELPAGVEHLAGFDDAVGRLYERCAVDWGVSTIRGANFCAWRFYEHPTHGYRAFGVRAPDGELRGLCVYRRAAWLLPDMGLVVDWLVPPDEVEAGALLEAAVQAEARREGVPALAGILVDWSPWFERFQEWGWRVHASRYFMGSRHFHPALDQLWLRDHWWYTLADLDLV